VSQINSIFCHFLYFQILSFFLDLNFEIHNWITPLCHFKLYNIFIHFIFQTHSFSSIIFQFLSILSFLSITFSYLHYFIFIMFLIFIWFSSFFRNIFYHLKERRMSKDILFFIISLLRFSITHFMVSYLFICYFVWTSNIVIEPRTTQINNMNFYFSNKKYIFLCWSITIFFSYTQK
jgi:hypothetical protein